MKAPVEVQFAQKLAANEKTERDKAVKKLKKWLGSRTDQLNEDEMMRIWKGLYYCYWMSDKMLVQEELAENIASMINCFDYSQSSLLFFKSFIRTFGREWFGIDQWRMNKSMMFVRRFLRHTFKFLSSKSWDRDLVCEIRNILKINLILCPPSDTSLGFQLHVTDVFLEELAKVGGDDLETEVLDLLLEPYVELVATSKDERLRKHVVERIFKHLVRQSDPGIDWEMEGEEGEEEDDEAEMEEDEDVEMEEDEEMEDNDESEPPSTSDNADTNGHVSDEENDAEDPRAGKVDVVIPQIPVDYSKWAVKLFDLGSGEGVKKANREDLYNISKMFKDVDSGVFPLGPNIDDEIEIPKISTKKSTKEIMKRNEEYTRKNLKNKEEYKKLKKNSLNLQTDQTEQTDEEQNENLSEDPKDEDDENQPEGEMSGDDEIEDSELPKKSSEEQKLKRKEAERKRKAALKKKKREAALKIQKENEDKQMKVQELLEHDMNIKSEGDHIGKTGKVKKRTITESNTTLDEDDSVEVPLKKKKSEKQDSDKENSVKAKKKKRKSVGKGLDNPLDQNTLQLNGTITSEKDIVENNTTSANTEELSEEKLPLIESEMVKDSKKKKKKNKLEESTPAKLDKKEDSPVKVVETDSNNKDQSIGEKSNKKLKKEKKKQMYRVDSDISFDTLSVSAVNLLDKTKVKEEINKPLSSISEVEPTADTSLIKDNGNEDVTTKPTDDTPKKKKKKRKSEVEPSADISLPEEKENIDDSSKPSDDTPKKKKKKRISEVEPTAEISLLKEKESEDVATKSLDDTPKKKKKKGKLGRYNAETSLLVTSSDPKVFEEPNDWDAPLLPGESEIVLPNKNYKGSSKLEEKSSEDETKDAEHPSPKITPVKSFSATFVKKAMSKTVTPKNKKTKKMIEEKSMTEPKKKINFMLTKNKEQELSDHLMSVKKSPQVPHNPDKNPVKTVLKKRKSLESGTKLNPVQLNTQLNSRSKAGKMLAGKRRKSAMDFF